MTIYTTDFSEYTIGVNLSDWTDFWSVGNNTYYAQTNSGDWKVGTKHCDFQQTADSRKAITWDDIGSVNDTDIITKINANTFTSGDGARVFSRVSGTSGSENSYHINVRSQDILLGKYVSGVSSILVSKAWTYANNANYWVRFQVNSTALKVKIWAEDVIEPNDWLIDTTDSSLSSGYCGFGGYPSTVDFEIDYFSCGTSTDDAVFPPSGWTAGAFGYVGDTINDSTVSSTRAMGGYFAESNYKLVGVRLNCYTHTSQVRVGVYSGGVLSAGLNNATLLYDFGLTTGSATGDIELSCSPIPIPSSTPIWIVVKGDDSGFGFSYSDLDGIGNAGNYQIARGRCDVNAIIGNDPDVAFPATFPDTNGTFANYWYDWDILISGQESLSSGEYFLTGSEVTFKYPKLAANSGNYSLVGQNINLLKTYIFSVETSEYSIISFPSDLILLNTITGDWRDYKGEGVWNFTEQPDKWGYLNNPRWADSPERSINYTGNEENEPQIWIPYKVQNINIGSSHHIDCGHWHKKKVISSATIHESITCNIYGLTDIGSSIYGVYFDGSKLSSIAYYYSSDTDINGLDWYGDHLITINGVDATSGIRLINTTPSEGVFSLESSHTPFNSYDVTYSVQGMITTDLNTGKIYYCEGIGTAFDEGGRLLKINANLTKDIRGFTGKVFYGTDGNKYIFDYVYASWAAEFKPITGEYYNSFCRLIADNICDVTVYNWGEEELVTCDATNPRLLVYNNYLYIVMNSSPNGFIRRYSLDTLEIDYATERQIFFPHNLIGYNNYIYVISGTFHTKLFKLNSITLEILIEQDFGGPDFGRAGDIVEMQGYLIVLHEKYITNQTIAKHEANTLNLIEYNTMSTATYLWQKIAKINDTYLAVGGNNHVGVFNINTMEFVDIIDFPATEETSVYTTKELIVKTL